MIERWLEVDSVGGACKREEGTRMGRGKRFMSAIQS